MNLESNINDIKTKAQGAQLIVVTKYQTIENIKKIYQLGERQFGENKVQDLMKKKSQLPNDIKWHMIGHLQKNKVKLIAPFIHTIQSVDTIDLLKKINQYAEKNNRKINCLIQIKIAKEVSKFGFNIDAAKKLLNSNYGFEYPHLNIGGIMAMATFTNNKNQIKREFDSLLNIKKLIKHQKPILSIGMSHDYQLAYKSGSNMIRIGSAIFQ
tara:strand:+ start:3649 stop:4281 length:633 start_codon:yes stop_codon:yes gene_type:complete